MTIQCPTLKLLLRSFCWLKSKPWWLYALLQLLLKQSQMESYSEKPILAWNYCLNMEWKHLSQHLPKADVKFWTGIDSVCMHVVGSELDLRDCKEIHCWKIWKRDLKALWVSQDFNVFFLFSLPEHASSNVDGKRPSIEAGQAIAKVSNWRDNNNQVISKEGLHQKMHWRMISPLKQVKIKHSVLQTGKKG